MSPTPSPEYIYNFPAITVETTPLKQLEKILSEATEACMSRNRKDRLIEVLDVIHACETELRIGYTKEEIDEAVFCVIEKNENRGYYD